MMAKALSFSMVDRLRWDLKQIFDMAVAEGYFAEESGGVVVHAQRMQTGGVADRKDLN
jgi:hypothetical protein